MSNKFITVHYIILGSVNRQFTSDNNRP